MLTAFDSWADPIQVLAWIHSSFKLLQSWHLHTSQHIPYILVALQRGVCSDLVQSFVCFPHSLSPWPTPTLDRLHPFTTLTWYGDLLPIAARTSRHSCDRQHEKSVSGSWLSTSQPSRVAHTSTLTSRASSHNEHPRQPTHLGHYPRPQL
jgi:hypothetical protein